MKQSIAHIALVVRDYDEAIEFFTTKLDFTLLSVQGPVWEPLGSGAAQRHIT